MKHRRNSLKYNHSSYIKVIRYKLYYLKLLIDLYVNLKGQFYLRTKRIDLTYAFQKHQGLKTIHATFVSECSTVNRTLRFPRPHTHATITIGVATEPGGGYRVAYRSGVRHGSPRGRFNCSRDTIGRIYALAALPCRVFLWLCQRLIRDSFYRTFALFYFHARALFTPRVLAALPLDKSETLDLHAV